MLMDSAMKTTLPALRRTTNVLPLPHGAVTANKRASTIARAKRQAQEMAAFQQKVEAAQQSENRDLARMLTYLACAVVVVFGVLFLVIRA
jgi:folate-dependent phosphoribosylglycinamide formyltransferase PurN